MKRNSTWRAERLVYLFALQKPTALQRRLVELARAVALDKTQQAELEALWRSERATVRAEQAMVTAKRVVERRGSSARRQRTRHLIELGGLVEIAGIGGDKGLALGAMLHLKKLLTGDTGVTLAGQFKAVGDAELHRRDVASRSLRKIVGIELAEDA